jgi:hypothetical protein
MVSEENKSTLYLFMMPCSLVLYQFTNISEELSVFVLQGRRVVLLSG